MHLISCYGWIDKLPYINIYDCWISPNTRDYVERCPWLRVYKSSRYKNVKGAHCLIHNWKPDVCRNFPVTVGQALKFGCGGYDHLSKTRLKQLLAIELIQIIQSRITAHWITSNQQQRSRPYSLNFHEL